MKRGILYTFLTQVPTLLLYFVASTMMTRLLGDVGRGEFALLNNQVVLFSLVTSLNLGLGITYFTAKASNDLRRSVGTAATLLLLTVLVLPLLLWVLSGSTKMTALLMPDHRTQWTYWGFVYLSIVLGLVSAAIGAVMLGLKKFRILNGMTILNSAMSATAFFALYLLRDRLETKDMLPAVLTITLSILIIQTSVWILQYAIHVKMIPLPVWSWPLIRPMLAFSMVGYFSNLINLVNYRFDVWVVDQYHGVAALGLYAVAVGTGQLLFYVPDPFSRVVQPYLFGQVDNEMLARYKAVARLNFTSLLVLGLFMGLMAPWVLPLLFGEVFAGSVLALQLLLPGIIFSGATKILSQLVIQQGQQSFNLLATAVGAIFTIGLDLLLIPAWGIEGAAVASTLSYLMILVVILIVIRRRSAIPLHDMFLLRISDYRLLRQQLKWT